MDPCKFNGIGNYVESDLETIGNHFIKDRIGPENKVGDTF